MTKRARGAGEGAGMRMAETKSGEGMSKLRRKLPGSLAGLCALLLAGCLPSADFKVAVKVVDEAGRPVPDALVLVGAYVSVEPPLEAPYDIGFSANRGMTSRDGIVRFSRLHGLYEGHKPEDAFYKMLESRQPKKKRGITGVKGGSIVVFAPRYGAFHQSFGVRDSPGFQQELKERGLAPQDYTGWFGRSDREWNYETVLIETRDVLNGGAVTVKVRKTSNPEHPHASFQPAVLWETERATSRVTGATVEDKERVYDFFVAQMEYAVAMSTDSFYEEKLESLRNPQQRKEYTDALRAWGQREHNHDTNVHEWMTRSALALLPQGYEEVKEYAGDILEGVKAEDDGLRPLKHFYNPFDPEYGYKGNPTALQWGAIGYPDNPNNEWDWQDARRYYQTGDKRKAYKALGHVLHLLEDLSVPMHTRNIRHVYQLDSEAAFELHFSKLAKTNEGLLAVYGMGAKTPAGGGLKENFEGLAKMTFGTFVEDRQPVDFDAFYAWERGKTGKQIKEPEDRTIDLMGRRLLPRAIEHSAGLLKGFYDQLHLERFARGPGKGDGDGGPGQSVQSSSVPPAGRDGNDAAKRRAEELFVRLKGPDETKSIVRLVENDPGVQSIIAFLDRAGLDERALIELQKIGCAGKDALAVLVCGQAEGRLKRMWPRDKSRRIEFYVEKLLPIVNDKTAPPRMRAEYALDIIMDLTGMREYKPPRLPDKFRVEIARGMVNLLNETIEGARRMGLEGCLHFGADVPECEAGVEAALRSPDEDFRHVAAHLFSSGAKSQIQMQSRGLKGPLNGKAKMRILSIAYQMLSEGSAQHPARIVATLAQSISFLGNPLIEDVAGETPKIVELLAHLQKHDTSPLVRYRAYEGLYNLSTFGTDEVKAKAQKAIEGLDPREDEIKALGGPGPFSSKFPKRDEKR